MSQQQVHAYLQPYVRRAFGGSFAGKTLTLKLTIPYPFTAYSFDPDNPSAPKQQGAYSVQFEIYAEGFFYQNSLIQFDQFGLVWHLECFKQIGVTPGGLPAFEKVGQFFRTTDPADIPVHSTSPWGFPIPASIDLRKGGYVVTLKVRDGGGDASGSAGSSTISMWMEIETLDGTVLHSQPGWQVVSDVGGSPKDWYSPLRAASFVVCGVGGGLDAHIEGSSFIVEFNGEVPDLVPGGQYWLQGIPYEEPVPGVQGYGTAEAGNYAYPIKQRNSFGDSALGINGYNRGVFVGTTGTLSWGVLNLADDEGGAVEFGFIEHGKDPAPPGAGFTVVQTVTADQDGDAWGTIQLAPGLRVFDGAVFDAYAYDAASSHAYTKPVVVNVSDSLVFQGAPQ